MAEMATARARVEQASREARSKQRELFAPEDAPESDYFRSLRERYRRRAIEDIESILETHRSSYDDAWNAWLRYPMVWESDLKDWIKDSDHIAVEGLSGRQRVPQRAMNHFLAHRS